MNKLEWEEKWIRFEICIVVETEREGVESILAHKTATSSLIYLCPTILSWVSNFTYQAFLMHCLELTQNII